MFYLYRRDKKDILSIRLKYLLLLRNIVFHFENEGEDKICQRR